MNRKTELVELVSKEKLIELGALKSEEIILTKSKIPLKTCNPIWLRRNLLFQDLRRSHNLYYGSFKDENLKRFDIRVPQKEMDYYIFTKDPNGKYVNLDTKEHFEKMFCEKYSIDKNNPEYAEADLSIKQRFMIDYHRAVKVEKGRYVSLFFDIEVNMSVRPDLADKEIISISSITDSDEKTTWVLSYDEENHTETIENCLVKFFNLEKDMLKDFMDYSNRFDILVAYFGFIYDFPYLVNRCKHFKVKNNWYLNTKNINYGFGSKYALDSINFILIDPLWELKHGRLFVTSNPKNYSLNGVAEWLNLDISKEKIDFIQSWRNKDFKDLIKYNITDVVILKKITESLGLCNIYKRLMETLPISFEDVHRRSWLIDRLLFQTMEKNVILPTKLFLENEESNVKGAFTMTPIKGLWKDVVVLDFSRFYPSVIMSLNLKVRGSTVFAGIIKDLYEFRVEIKRKKKETTDQRELDNLLFQDGNLKCMVNAAYGILAYPGFRLYDPRAAAIVTRTGRIIIKRTIAMINEKYGKAIYSDTDSIFVAQFDINRLDELNENIREIARSITSEVHYFGVELETEFDNIYFTEAKKRYFGIVRKLKGSDRKGFLYVRGMELIRKDTPEVCRIELNRIIRRFLKDGVIEYNKEKFIEKMKKEKLINLLVKMEPHKNTIADYKSNHIIKQGMINSMKYITKDIETELRGSEEASRIVGLLWVKSYLDTKAKVLLFLMNSEMEYELPKGFEIDYESYFNKFVKKKLDNLNLALPENKSLCDYE